MVELGVPTCSFGNPPDPLLDPPYPGVSPTAFDQCGALAAYRDILKAERSCKHAGQLMVPRILANRGRPMPATHVMGDIMPGHANLKSYYERLGYTFNAVGLPVPPKDLEHSDAPPVVKQRKKPPEERSAEANAAADRKAYIPEHHSRLQLLEAWHDQMKASNTRRIPKSPSEPNLGALWPKASRKPSRCASDVGEDALSQLSVAVSGISAGGSQLRGSQMGSAMTGVSSATPSELRQHMTWHYDMASKGPVLLAAGAPIEAKFGDMKFTTERPRFWGATVQRKPRSHKTK